MHRRSPVVPLTLLAGTALMLSACTLDTPSSTATPTGSSTTPTTAKTGSSTTATPDAAPGATSSAPSGTPEDNSAEAPDWGSGSQGEQAAEGSTLTVSDLRVGNHPKEGFSRVVVEFDGQGAPGWNQPQWDVPAYTSGKGDPITVQGDHTMVVRGTGVAAVPPDGQKKIGHRQITPTDYANDGSSIDSVYIDPGFEGEFQVVLGTDSQTYRIFSLSNPTRLVIDIAHG